MVVDPLTTNECAELLGTDIRHVRRLIESNRLKAYQMPTPTGKKRRYLVMPEVLLKFAAVNKMPKQIVAGIKAKVKGVK